MTMVSSSRNEANEPFLHPVWRKQPAYLMKPVLKRVPFESLVCFRVVCKRFNSLITLPKFVCECQPQQAWKPVPMIVHHSIEVDSSSIEIFNSETNSWLMHPLPILEANLYPLRLALATGGLLCFNTEDDTKTVVYNPLRGAFRLLACPNSPDSNDRFSLVKLHRIFTGLVVDRQAGTFTLVVVTTTESEANGRTLLYDSAVGSWRSGAPLLDVGCICNSVTLTSNESIYGLVSSLDLYTDKLVKYDVRNDNWSAILMVSEELDDVDLEIEEHRRQLVVVSTATTPVGRMLQTGVSEFEKTFYTVRKAETGHGEPLVDAGVVRGVQWVRGVLPRVEEEPRNVESLFHGWIDNFGDFDTTESGDVICITRCADPFIDAQHLHRAMQVLPKAWPRNDFEIKLLEPSLTVDI